jgi:RimJ/RimL family protein N-acetyltransferase
MLKLAEAHHIPDIKLFCKKFFEESPYNDYPYDNTKVDKVIEDIVSAKGKNYVAIVYEVDGKTVGCISGSVVPFLLYHGLVATEIMWWVEPDYRRSKAGLELLRAFESWAVYSKCDMVQMISLNTEIGKALSTVYRRKGYVETEQAYIKRLTSWD